MEHNALTPQVVKRLLKDLLDRLEAMENGGQTQIMQGRNYAETGESRCALHGTWISAISGVAFELETSSEPNVLKVYSQFLEKNTINFCILF